MFNSPAATPVCAYVCGIAIGRLLYAEAAGVRRWQMAERQPSSSRLFRRGTISAVFCAHSLANRTLVDADARRVACGIGEEGEDCMATLYTCIAEARTAHARLEDGWIRMDEQEMRRSQGGTALHAICAVDIARGSDGHPIGTWARAHVLAFQQSETPEKKMACCLTGSTAKVKKQIGVQKSQRLLRVPGYSAVTRSRI